MKKILSLLFLATSLTGTEVPYGAHATLRATGNGVPAPVFEWFKDGVKVGAAANFVIAAATLNDAGTYVCRGANGIGPGASSTPIVVEIAQAPVITASFPNVTIPKQSNHTLAVTAYGPELTYKWFKDGRSILDHNLPTFTITKAKPPDAGTYECEVSNELGTVSAKAKVTVR